MKRKLFLRNAILLFGAAMFPKIDNQIRNDTDCNIKNKLGLTDVEIAQLKLQRHIIKMKPSGCIVDMKYVREIIEKRKM